MSACNSGDRDEYTIRGAHGTIAPQGDEAFYDDRSDADDDMEKGRLKFPTALYGRDRELETLQNIYDRLVQRQRSSDKKGEETAPKEGGEVSMDQDNSLEGGDNPPSCIFLGGYSGIGKSALVREFIKRMENKYYQHSDTSAILHATGKYAEQRSASSPFSAISEVLESLAIDFSGGDEQNEMGKHRPSSGSDLASKLKEQIQQSDLIGPGTEGNQILRKTFPVLASLLDSVEDATFLPVEEADDGNYSTVHPSMNAIKECTGAFFSSVCESTKYPVIIFLDDLQWGDQPFFELLSFLLTRLQFNGILFICSYRSNEVDADHSLTKLMDEIAPLERVDLFSLSPDAVTHFISDSVKREDDEAVAELAEAVYTKTMGNIFFVMQALEELVRKNILFYDVMCFEWRWVCSKVELGNYMSDDVVDSVKGKIRDLHRPLQHLLSVMAYIPHNSLDVPLLTVLMNQDEQSFEESEVNDLLKQASDEGMLLLSTENKHYRFSHDRVRQASYEFAVEENQDHQLPLHISQVLMNCAQGSHMDWALYVAVDLLNALPPELTSRSDLIQLNLRVAKIAKSCGAIEKENDLLRKGLKCLNSSGIMWKGKFYALSLELYNSAIVSEYSLGNYNIAMKDIDIVLRNASSLDDMLVAYLHQLQCKMNETSDYKQGALDGVTILNKYGFQIPTKLTKPYLVKEEMKLKLALRNQSFLSLVDLPPCPPKDDPVFHMFSHVQFWAIITGNEDLMKVITWKSIQCAVKRGRGRHLPPIISSYSNSLAKQGKVETAQEYGRVAIALAEKIRGDVEIYTFTQMTCHAGATCQLQPFRNSVDPLLQSYKDSKLHGGDVMVTLGCLLGYFHAYFAAGLQLGPLLESKLTLAEECSQNLDRNGFLTTFQILRQSALNLRIRTVNAAIFHGDAFREDEALEKMNENARKMALRDSSSSRLMVAFVFQNKDIMAKMLAILKDYPLQDIFLPRLHNRLCFSGLAAVALSCEEGGETFAKLAKNCLGYFAHLTKHGSVNAKPVHLFMLALKNPSREGFQKAIESCAEARMIHLEAMAREHYALFLQGENDDGTAREYLTASYWLYQEWGAHAKALQLSNQHEFLRNVPRKQANSLTLSLGASDHSAKVNGDNVASYRYNTTFRRGSRLFVKR